MQSDHTPAIAAAGQQWVLDNLTPEALSCYWYGALQRYGELYFMEETEAQKKAKEEAAKSVVDGGAKQHGGKEKRRKSDGDGGDAGEGRRRRKLWL